MVSPVDLRKVAKSLYDDKYVDVYAFLPVSLDNLRSRGTLLNNDIQELEKRLKEMVERANAESERMNPDDVEICSLFKELQYVEMDIIQRLSILTELLAVFYHGIRTDLRKLPSCIGKADFTERMLHREFNYFNTQGLSDVWNNFKYPNVSKFSELSSEEQDILKRLLEESSKKTLQAFKEIFRFQKNFRTVYNKCKHTLSEFAGVFGLDIAKKTIDTKIYVRHKEQDKVYTYVIPLSLEESHYFTEVAARVYYLLRTLIDNALLYIVNEEKDFIPRTVFIDKTNEAKYTEIAGKVRSCVMPNFGAKMVIKTPTGEDLEIINKELEEKFIYRMNRDIIELDALLKGQLIIS